MTFFWGFICGMGTVVGIVAIAYLTFASPDLDERPRR